MLWFDGRLRTGPGVEFDVSDRGLTLGDGVFDTALSASGRIVFEAAHIRRLTEAAASLGFPADAEAVRTAMRAVAAAADAPDVVVRTTLTRGSGPRGLAPPAHPQPRLWVTAVPARRDIAFTAMTLLPSPIRRNDTSPASRVKTLGYLDAVLGARDAAASGFDDALFLNTQDRIACAGTGNLFLVGEEGLLTPPASDGVLAGVVRAEILRIAAEAGIAARERSLTLRDLAAAEAVFLTNSLRGLAPVQAVGDRAFASAGHPVVQALAGRLRQAIARDADAA